MKRFRLWLVLGLLAPALTAQTTGDPASWLGLTPEAAYAVRGAPAEVYPVALDEATWNAVHFYADHSYLFWSSNRVWQVRLDKQWSGTWQGLPMGTARSEVEAALGEPVARTDQWSVWNLPYQTFPRRLRLIFVDGLLSDAYLYRSEF